MSQVLKAVMACCIAVGMIMTTVNAELKVSGKIMDLKGKPLAGAKVKLIRSKQSTVSGSDGSFSFDGTGNNTATISSFNGGIVQPQFATLHSGYLEINASRRTIASITAFNLGGKVIFHKEQMVEAGVHAFPVSNINHGVMLFRIQADGNTVNLKAYSIGGVIQGNLKKGKRVKVLRTVAQQVTGVPPILDTLYITNEGYLDFDMQICKTEVKDLSLRMAPEDTPVWWRQNITEAVGPCHASTILQLKDGTLMTAYFGGAREGSKPTKIYVNRKEPGAEKWGKGEAVGHGMRGGKKHGVGNPSLFQSRSGKILLLYKTLPRAGYMRTSMDEGKTWTPERDICKGCLGTEKNKPLQIADGRILSPKADRTGAQGGGVGFEVSYDDGETWQFQKLAKLGAIQPAVLELADGSLKLFCRTRGGLMPTVSTPDYGKTWGGSGKSVLPSTGCGFDGLTLRDGRHILVYNHHHSKGKGPRKFLVMAMSKDGQNWSAAQVISIGSGQHSYAGVIQGYDGLLYMSFTWNRKSIGHVVVNPYKITDATLVPMPSGQWPNSGPLSQGANGDKKD